MQLPQPGMRRADAIAGGLIVAVATWFLYHALQLPTTGIGWDSYRAPGIVPSLVSGVLILMGLALIFKATAPPKTARQNEETGEDDRTPAEKRRSLVQIVITLILCLGYVLSLGRIPYWAATALFLAVFMQIFGGVKRHPAPAVNTLLTIATAGALTVILMVVFQNLFRIPLP